MFIKNVITPGVLADDFLVDTGIQKLYNEGVAVGVGTPNFTPSPARKNWTYIDRSLLRMTHFWDVPGQVWTPLNAPETLPALKIVSTDTTTNLTSTTATPFAELFGAEEFNDANTYSVDPATAQIKAPGGRYELSGYWAMNGGLTSNAARNNFDFWVTLDGTPVTPKYRNNYLRDATGNNEVGQGIPTTPITIPSGGGVLQLLRQRVSGIGGVQTLHEESVNFFYLKRVV